MPAEMSGPMEALSKFMEDLKLAPDNEKPALLRDIFPIIAEIGAKPEWKVRNFF